MRQGLVLFVFRSCSPKASSLAPSPSSSLTPCDGLYLDGCCLVPRPISPHAPRRSTSASSCLSCTSSVCTSLVAAPLMLDGSSLHPRFKTLWQAHQRPLICNNKRGEVHHVDSLPLTPCPLTRTNARAARWTGSSLPLCLSSLQLCLSSLPLCLTIHSGKAGPGQAQAEVAPTHAHQSCR